MASSEGIPEKKFKLIKMVFSSWYDNHHRLSMLKVLFRDIITYNELARATTIDLLNILTILDVLKPTNLTILGDTISVTEQFSLQSVIKKHLPSFPDVKEGTISTHFQPYRLKLMKFGILLDEKYVEKIDDLYNNPTSKKYADVWSMITDLEDRIIISPTEGKMNEFISDLESLGLDIKLALNALTEDKDPSMDIDRPTGEPVQQPDKDPSMDIDRPTGELVQQPDKDSSMDIDRPTGEPVKKPDIQDSSWFWSSKPVQKPESSLKTYRMTSGICLIINNSEFQGNKLNRLPGYNYDEESLENVFKEYFGFHVDIRRNIKASEIEDAIYTYSQADYTNYDCFICCILSHGAEGSVSGIDCKRVDIARITNPFRSTTCKGLVGKPKLFFIQACMGRRIPDYVAASADEVRRLWPDDLDFLFCYSTVEGNLSFVNNGRGSLYIQTLTKSLRNEPVKNIFNILTCVTNEVSRMEMKIWNDSKQDVEKVTQIPFLKSTLSRQLIFSPK